jgi:hypothetical protein
MSCLMCKESKREMLTVHNRYLHGRLYIDTRILNTYFKLNVQLFYCIIIIIIIIIIIYFLLSVFLPFPYYFILFPEFMPCNC